MKKFIYTILICILVLSFTSCSNDNEPETSPSGEVSVTINISNQTPAKYENITFEAIIESQSDIDKVIWNCQGKEIGTGMTITYHFTEEGEYPVTVKVVNSDKREGSASKSVTVSGTSLKYALNTFDSNKTWIMGHRGNTYQSNAPENSIKGIESCIALNGIVNVVEIDPRRTKDGIIILMHDETIDRTTTGKGKVKDLTLKEIQSYQLKLDDGTVTSEKVPTLYDALLSGKGKIYFDLDVKDVPVKEVYDIVKSAGMLEQVFFYTEDIDVVKTIINYTPSPIVYPQCIEASDIDVLASLDIKMAQLSLSKALDTNFPENLQQKGLLWTTNILDMKGYDYDTQMLQGNYTGIDKLLVKNVNMIQTDYPQVLASYLESKGRR